MRWFEGSIPDAINSAKRRGCVFVVVVSGEDEQSAQLMSSWEDDKVSEEAQNCCVAIKVDASSQTCVQFSQIYPVVCIPSCFFIGDNGIPLEVIAGSVSSEELMKRINRVKQMHVQHIEGGAVLQEASAAVESNCDTTEPASAVAWPIKSAATATATVQGTGDDDSMSTTEVLVENASSDHATQCTRGEENLDAKVERLTKKLEDRREQRKIGEEENEIKREVERRKVGKDLQDFKRKQEEDKTKRLLEERNRDKAEEKAARERVKQQIALDRADRAARYAKTQEEDVAKRALLHTRQAEQELRKESLGRERSTIARIQFRLPNGSSLTNQFPSETRLQEARNFVVQEVGNRYGNFSLATMFPRREFTTEDLNKTLLELELAPSASIVLLPQSGRPGSTVDQSSGGGIWAILGTLLYPLLAVWGFLSSFLFTTPPRPAAEPRGPTHQSSSYTKSTSNKAKRETLSKHNLEKRPNDFKKDGKICRLRTHEDSEEDNNTWNGNSTQQM